MDKFLHTCYKEGVCLDIQKTGMHILAVLVICMDSDLKYCDVCMM